MRPRVGPTTPCVVLLLATLAGCQVPLDDVVPVSATPAAPAPAPSPVAPAVAADDGFADEPATTPQFGASRLFPPLAAGEPELETLPQGALEIGPTYGWFKGVTVALRFFPRPSVGPGRNKSHHADLFVFVRADGTPIDQPFLLEAVPKGAAGPDVLVPDAVARAFSSRWEVHILRMSDAYDPASPAMVVDSVTKLVSPLVLEDIETNVVLNCPVLPPGATIPTDPSVIHAATWDGHPVRIATYEVDDSPQAAIPLYVFQATDGSFVGRPVVVRIPGQANYSSLWDVRAVQVPAGFVPNSLRSHEAIVRSGLPVRALGFQVNCPVVAVGTEVGLVSVTHEDVRSLLFRVQGKFSDTAFPFELRDVPYSSDRTFKLVSRGLSTDDPNHNFIATQTDPSFELQTLQPNPGTVLDGLIHDSAGRLCHLEQTDLDKGALTPPIDSNMQAYLPDSASFEQKVALVGRALFEHEFTKEEGGGPVLNRMSCASCHATVATGGSGPAMFNVQQVPTPDTFDLVPAASQLARAMRTPLPANDVAPLVVRRTPHLFGVGLKEALARERQPDGSDAAPFPFKRKGTVTSLRDFTTTALEGELGIQAVERVAATAGVSLEAARGLDPDGDGVTGEATVGDVTALVVFQALLSPPGRQPVLGLSNPADPVGPDGLLPGERRFATPLEAGGLGCASCHTPSISLAATRLFLGNPETAAGITVDLPASELRAYSDFRRHKLGSPLADGAPQDGVAADVFLTKELWGLGSSPPYLHDGRAGNDVAAAIEAHRGRPLEGVNLRTFANGALVGEVATTGSAVTVELPAGTTSVLVQVGPSPTTSPPVQLVVTRIAGSGVSIGGADGGGTGPGATFVLSGEPLAARFSVVAPPGQPVVLELVAVDAAGASEALASTEAWLRLAPADKASVIRFLRSLRAAGDMVDDRGFEVEDP